MNNDNIVLNQEVIMQAHGNFDLEVEDELNHLQVQIEAGDWESVERRMKTNPDEIIGSTFSTALHIGLEGGVMPLYILISMIELEPLSASIVDRKGNTPLHIACGSQFAYNPHVIAVLLAAYPQAVLMQDYVEKSTPLGMLLSMGGDINIDCITLLLDVAYSRVAGFPPAYVLSAEFLLSPLENCLLVAGHFPPILAHFSRLLAISDPYAFPAFMRPFLHIQIPPSLINTPHLMENQPKILLIQDGLRQCPLHVASRQCASQPVVKLLLSDDRYPGAFEAPFIMERKDRYPLFYCALYHAPIDAAQLVFDRNEEAIEAYEQYGLTPYQACVNAPHYNIAERGFELTRTRENPHELIQDFFVESRSYIFFQQLEFYLRLTFGRVVKSETFSIIHAIAAIPSPPYFMRCAIRLFPWQLSTRDSDGCLPLHLACKVRRMHGINKLFYWMKEDVAIDMISFRLIPEVRAKDNPIAILTEAYIQGASALDGSGSLPLHLAILSGKTVADGIVSLIHAAPVALATRDNKYKLYPFMLAATVGDLELTYYLLLANPIMVQSGLG
jgi:ankyrin repeat protein